MQLTMITIGFLELSEEIKMGDDAEYYMEQMEEEKRFQQSIKDSEEEEMTRRRILRESKIESDKKNQPKKDWF